VIGGGRFSREALCEVQKQSPMIIVCRPTKSSSYDLE